MHELLAETFERIAGWWVEGAELPPAELEIAARETCAQMAASRPGSLRADQKGGCGEPERNTDKMNTTGKDNRGNHQSAFGGSWVRFACPCGYTRETLDTGEQTAACELCGRPVKAEAMAGNGGKWRI